MTSLDVLGLDGALSNLVSSEVSLLTEEDLELDDL